MYYITASGRRINIATIHIQDMCLKDIAHALTKICRYGGALPLDVHYSVARHSINMYEYTKREGYSLDVQRMALMHDASEAYLGDVVTGLKRFLPDYRALEDEVNKCIYYRYSIIHWDKYINKIVKELDTRIILDEAKVLAKHHYKDFVEQMPNVQPLGIIVKADSDLNATMKEFLKCCKEAKIND